MSISSQNFLDSLNRAGIGFFTGVPDSTLKSFCAYLTDQLPSSQHIVAANEGGAVGIAAGYNLATGNIPAVYMQNSGLGNAINPLTSLVDPLVYSIPMLLIVGWRGEPGTQDEPQHAKQGLITLPLLSTLGIPNTVVGDSIEMAQSAIELAVNYIASHHAPYALVIKKGLFDKYIDQSVVSAPYPLLREQVISLILNKLSDSDVVVSTTGMTSRELFEQRERRGEGHAKDFLTVGSMGHASQIALGIALQKPDRQVYCLDGDGAAIMHMGGLAIIGSQLPANFKHIILNNGAHESVGGQPTVGWQIDLPAIARSCGYVAALTAQDEKSINEALLVMQQIKGPVLLEIRVTSGHRADLGRPTATPRQNKQAFMEFIK
ncbi:MAG: phosphonopyruvate decarboxylase [Patescibacteria group bacterium]|jgi:phosphonopyruvate decarboxylase